MPLYEYICTRCDQITDALRSMDQADAPISCDHCNNIKTKRVHSVFATTTSGGAGSEGDLSAAPCSRCGDPGGSCGLS
jgi:putative FmdB family regulatory protein